MKMTWLPWCWIDVWDKLVASPKFKILPCKSQISTVRHRIFYLQSGLAQLKPSTFIYGLTLSRKPLTFIYSLALPRVSHRPLFTVWPWHRPLFTVWPCLVSYQPSFTVWPCPTQAIDLHLRSSIAIDLHLQSGLARASHWLPFIFWPYPASHRLPFIL